MGCSACGTCSSCGNECTRCVHCGEWTCRTCEVARVRRERKQLRAEDSRAVSRGARGRDGEPSSGASALMQCYRSIPWRSASRSQTRSPRPASDRDDRRSLGEGRDRGPGPFWRNTRFTMTRTAGRLASGAGVPVGLTPDQAYRIGASIRGDRGWSAGELGAIGRSRSGPGYRSPFAHAVRVPPRRAGRPLCDRCMRQRPGERIRCVSCQRRVGPGCTPGCLLVE